MDNLKKWAMLLLILNMGIVIYYGQSIKKEIRVNRTLNERQVQDITNQILYQSSQITQNIRTIINERDNLVTNFNYTILKTNDQLNTGEVELVITLKESSKNSNVIGEFQVLGSSQTYTVVFDKRDGLTYRGLIDIPLNHNYELNLYEQTENETNKQLNTTVYSLHFYNEFYADRISRLGSYTSTNGQRLTYKLEFKYANDHGFNKDIDKITLQFVNSRLDTTTEFDVTNKLSSQVTYDKQLEDKYKIAIASGEISSELTYNDYVQQFHAQSSNEDNQALIYYIDVNLTQDDLAEHWEDVMKGNYYFNTVVIFEDGIAIQL